MEYLVLLLLFCFLLFSVAVLFFYTSLIVGLILAKGVPFVSLPKKDWYKMCQSAKLKAGETVFDLGCGKANLLTVAVKDFKVKGVGYEISLWPYFWACLRNWFYQTNLRLELKNFLKADLSSADVVFCYLFPYVMGDLEQKFTTELKSGARVVSYAFKLPNREPSEVILGNSDGTGKIYIYNY
jgi:hypothetical protein